MNVWRRIRQLSVRQLLQLSWVFLKNPLLVAPFIKATRQTLHISSVFFGKSHHNNGKANAFRHALWNILICAFFYKRNKNEEKSSLWAEKLTHLHEKLAPNNALEKAMDLHNNAIGRHLFLKNKDISEDKMIALVKEEAEKSQKVTSVNEIKKFKNTLVHID